MKSLQIEPTQNTPKIDFNSSTGDFWIVGQSKPEHPIDFYKPIINWLNNRSNIPDKLTLNVQLDYFNSSSNKLLFEVIKTIANYKNASINWYYDPIDETMFDCGKDYSGNVEIPFNLCPSKN